jgi:hypothetical protein
MLKGKVVGSQPRPQDREQIQRAARLFFDAEHGVQIQGLPSGRLRICRADDMPSILDAANAFSDDRGVYFSLNPCPADLAHPIKVGDMLYRHLFLLDFDPVRPPDTNSTKGEKKHAANLARKTLAYLQGERGWPEPIKTDSGNGYHGYYLVHLPNDDAARVLLREVLKALAERFDTDKAKIDRKVHNSNRIAKLPGTWACKGPESEERPHRMCRILSAPANPQMVTLEQLQAVLDDLKSKPAEPTNGESTNGEQRPKGMRGKATGDKARGEAYALAALRDECWAVSHESKTGHNRNNRLNDAALKLGTLVGAGYISRNLVEMELLEAARRCELPEEEARRTIRSGIEAGILKPRTIPPESDGQAASGASTAPAPWDTPLPLGDVPAVLPFPLDVFPQPLQDFAVAVAESMNCPVDFAAVPMLTFAGAAIGASRAVQIKEGWAERPALYTAMVGLSGDGKSPAQEKVAQPFYDAQIKLRAKYQREMEAYEEADPKERGDKPIEKTLWVEDVTAEKYADLLMENKRGIVQICDELTGLVNRLNCYKNGKGGDRQFYLSGWSGKPVRVDRKNRDESVFVPHPFIALTGGLPPTMLPTLRGDQALYDGWMERFLFCWPVELPDEEEQWKYVPSELANVWKGTIDNLFDLPMVEDKETGPRPYFIRFTRDTRPSWQQFTARLAGALNDPLLPECLHGAYKKMKGYCARLGLIVQMLRFAHKETEDDEEVDAESITRAARLISYFGSHARKVYAEIDADPRIAEAKRVLTWIKTNSAKTAKSAKGSTKTQMTLSQRDLHRGVWGGSREVSLGLEVINLLVRHGFLRPVLEEKREGAGRNPSPKYEVHPSLLFS